MIKLLYSIIVPFFLNEKCFQMNTFHLFGYHIHITTNERGAIMQQTLQTLKTEMKTAENKLRNIAHSIPTTNANEHAEILKKITAINHAYLIVSSECSEKKRPSRTKNQRTSKTIIINGTEATAKTRKEALQMACRKIVQHNYKDIKANNDKFVSSVTGKHFASINKDDVACDNPTEIKSGKKTFYYDPTKILTNDMMLFKKMLKTLNLPTDYLSISKENSITA